MIGMCRAFAIVLAVSLSVPVAAQTTASLKLTTTPDPLGLGQNRFDVVVTDAKGQPIADADVALSLVMPADPKTKHPEMRTSGTLNNIGGGKYNGLAFVSMAGVWHVTATAMRGGKSIGQTKVSLTAYATRRATPKTTRYRRKGPDGYLHGYTAQERDRLYHQAEFLADVVSRIPVGRVGTTAEVAAAVIFLASKEAAMVNGTSILVDGGWTAQ